ncbi:MAG: DUF2085 domain-containing protein [Candidatus Anstonellales archaeon]
MEKHKKRRLVIYFFVLLLTLINFFILITPVFFVLKINDLGLLFYNHFSFLCHQLDSRSICLTNNFMIVNCLENPKFLDKKKSTGIVLDNGIEKYKFPVCSRDIAIYLFLLVGLVYSIRKHGIDFSDVNNFTLLYISLIPIAIDGSLQTLTEFNIILPYVGPYESNNLLRILTGSIAGFSSGYFLLPLLNYYLKFFFKEE